MKKKRHDAPLTPQAAGYLRQSKLERGMTDADIQALAADRKKDLENKAAELGLVIVKWYADLDLSGTSIEKREGFLDLLDAIKAGEVTHLFACDSSRLFRNQYEQEVVYAELLEPHGVQVVFSQEAHIEDEILSRFNRQMMGAAHELYARLAGRKVAAKHRRLAEAGLWAGGQLPLGIGWDKTNRRFIETEGADTVRLVYALFCETPQFHPLTRRLNAEGHLFRGHPFRMTNVQRLLKSAFYRGYQPLGGQLYPAASLPQIVDAETLSAVDTILSGWRFAAHTRGNSSRSGPLSGRLRCSLCGAAYVRLVKNERPGGTLYGCSRKWLAAPCAALTIAETKLLRAVQGVLTAYLQREGERHAAWLSLLPPDKPKAAKPSADLDRLRQRRQRLHRLLLDVEETDSQYIDLMGLLGELNEAIRKAEAQPLREEQTPRLDRVTFDEAAAQVAEFLTRPPSEQRELIELLEVFGETDGNILSPKVLLDPCPPVPLYPRKR